jgi:hypothetical protein
MPKQKAARTTFTMVPRWLPALPEGRVGALSLALAPEDEDEEEEDDGTDCEVLRVSSRMSMSRGTWVLSAGEEVIL